MLRQHPQIFMPDKKEPRYFATDLPSAYNPRRPNVPAAGYEDYLALFDGAAPDQLVGEASPVYIWSQTAAENIARTIPDARIIAIFREPASYIRSLHYQLIEARIEQETDLGKAIALEPTRIGPRPGTEEDWPEVLQYTAHCDYADQLRRFHAHFPHDQVKVIIYDDFRRDNDATLRDVLRFLGVAEDVPIHAKESNPTVRMRSQRVDGVVQAMDRGSTPAARAVKTAVRAVAPRSVRRRAYDLTLSRLVFGSPRPADDEVMLELKHRFRPEVEAFGDYLQRDLVALWGYDAIA